MTLLSLIPTTLFAALILTSVICCVAGSPTTPDRFVWQRSRSNSIHFIDSQVLSQDDIITSILNMEQPNTEMGPPPLPSPDRVTTGPIPRRGSKRLSLNFQLPSSDTPRSRPTSMIAASPSSSRPISPELEPSVEKDPGAFLTALAAQERRVLELKEELQKAETDLGKLKTKWAVHEATKKRNEIHRVEPLREMASTPQRTSFEAGALQRSRTNIDDERKRALYIRTKHPQRKVFSGGRHTRALSLLSPSTMSEKAASPTSPNMSSASHHARNSMPLSAGATRLTHTRTQTQGSQRDVYHTGKQIVGDIREGLWTFIEDLKQATVGDEAVSGARTRQTLHAGNASQSNSRRRSPAGSSPTVAARSKDQVSLDGTIEQVPTRDTTSERATKPRQESTDPMVDEDDDGWDNWDSPPPKTSESATFSTTAGSSPRTSVR